jgi:protein tyrosine/serine phosphatase
MKIYKKIVVIILLVFIFDAQASLKNIFNKLSVFNKKNKQQVGHVFDNFYSVEDGVFYRAQQLSKSDLDKYIKQFSIKTVINLRGNKDARWWQKEKAVSEYNGALFFSLDMSAIYLTTKASLIRLLTIYQDAPRPILVHCIGGADRTGEASALWILDQQKKGKEEALKQLSIKYGHRKYKNSAKDFLIEIWQGKEWAFNSYDHRNYPTQCKPEDLH